MNWAQSARNLGCASDNPPIQISGPILCGSESGVKLVVWNNGRLTSKRERKKTGQSARVFRGDSSKSTDWTLSTTKRTPWNWTLHRMGVYWHTCGGIIKGGCVCTYISVCVCAHEGCTPPFVQRTGRACCTPATLSSATQIVPGLGCREVQRFSERLNTRFIFPT